MWALSRYVLIIFRFIILLSFDLPCYYLSPSLFAIISTIIKTEKQRNFSLSRPSIVYWFLKHQF
jgi:hypothetical protein